MFIWMYVCLFSNITERFDVSKRSTKLLVSYNVLLLDNDQKKSCPAQRHIITQILATNVLVFYCNTANATYFFLVE